MLNPTIATITLPSATATSFRMRYLLSGSTVAEVVSLANYTNAGSYVQALAPLNALVPEGAQGASMTLVINAVNTGGESLPVPAATPVEVVLPPGAPLTIVLS